MAQEKQWYYVKNNQQVGPVTQSELLQLFQPQLSAETPVWTQGMDNWVVASKVEGLLAFASVGVTPPSFSGGASAPQTPVATSAHSQGEQKVTSTASAESHHSSMESSHHPLSTATFAGFWIRFGAYLLDWLIFVFTYGIFGGIGYGIFSATATEGMPPVWVLVILGFFGFLLFVASFLYYPILESSKMQATLGKKICGLKIVDAHGNRMGFGLAFGRLLMKGVSFSLTGGIGWMIAGMTLKKQSFHDKIMDTFVIKGN